MDSPEDERSAQLDLNGEQKSDFETVFQNNFMNLNMKLPVPAALQELVVITNSGAGFLNEHPTDGNEPLGKRLCIEQDGQTFILALQDGLEGFSNVVEIQPKSFSTLEASQLFQEANNLTNKEGINQNWFTSREEKTTLHNKGHLWKQGMWSKEEIELLENNIQLYCKEHEIVNPATIVFEMSKDERKDFYRTIAKGLNRPLFSVYRRVIRMYDNKNHVGKYTSDELEKLKKLRSVHGNDWQAIGAAMGRSASSIKDRCRLMKDNCNQGKWLPAEERRLAEAVYDLTNALPGEMISTGLSWAIVAERVGTRSEKQCRTKWLNYLNWKVAGGTDWTREDDLTLIYRVYTLNATDENQVDWNELSKDWLSVRSPQWLRGKWWSLKRHAPNSNTISFQEVCEYLYQHFVLKMKIKDEEIPNADCVLTNSLLHTNFASLSQTLFSRPKASTPPPIGAAQVGSPPVVTLTNAPCVDLSSVTPLIQTLEVLPQNIQITTNPHTFLLTTPTPLTAAANQIIIQTCEEIQTTSLASTQIPSVPPSPSEVEETNQILDDSENISEETAHNEGDKSTHLISSDPMLAASHSPDTDVDVGSLA